MGPLKSFLLGTAMLLMGLVAFFLAVITLILAPVFPKLRFYANQFFIVPFGYFARWLVGIKLVILNGERVEQTRPAVLVGNHQTGLDFAIISRSCPGGMVIVAKREIRNLPVFGWFFWIAGNVLIDRSNPRAAKKQMDDARATLMKMKLNLAVFPEGTRNKTEQMLPFKKGAFHIAVSMGFPILPIVCSNLKGKAIWERKELAGGYAVVSVLEPVPTAGVAPDQVDALMELIRSRMVAEYERINVLAGSYDERGSIPKSESCCN